MSAFGWHLSSRDCVQLIILQCGVGLNHEWISSSVLKLFPTLVEILPVTYTEWVSADGNVYNWRRLVEPTLTPNIIQIT